MIVEQRHGDRSWKLRVHVLNSKHKTERELGMACGFENSKPAPSDGLPLARRKIQGFEVDENHFVINKS